MFVLSEVVANVTKLTILPPLDAIVCLNLPHQHRGRLVGTHPNINHASRSEKIVLLQKVSPITKRGKWAYFSEIFPNICLPEACDTCRFEFSCFGCTPRRHSEALQGPSMTQSSKNRHGKALLTKGVSSIANTTTP